jgi:hypothetical protein
MVVVVQGRDFCIEHFNLFAREKVGGRDLTGRRISEVFPELQRRGLRGGGAERRSRGRAKPLGQDGERIGHRARTLAFGLDVRSTQG